MLKDILKAALEVFGMAIAVIMIVVGSMWLLLG